MSLPRSAPGPEHAAVEAAAAAPEDFLARGFPTWEWMFHLVRRLRSVEGISKEIDPWLLKGAVRAFCRRAAELAPGGEYDDDESADDRLTEFLNLWPHVRLAEGEGPLELAFARAHARGLIPDRCPSRAYALVVSTAYYLQLEVGAGAIFLPIRRLGALLGKSPKHVAHLLHLAMDRGLLQLVEKESFVPGGARRARRFNFDLESKGYKLPERSLRTVAAR